MESQKIKNLLDHKDEEYSEYQTKKWYIINDRNNGQYGQGILNDSPIKIDTEVVKPFLCDYGDAYILVTGDKTVVRGDVNTKAAFKNFHPLVKSEIHLNDDHVETVDNLDLTMNLIEYSDNYSDSAASLYQFKRQEPLPKNANLTPAYSSLFKYKSDLLGRPININAAGALVGDSPVWENTQIIVPLKYVSSFFRSLDLPLINTKLYIQLNYTKNSVISTVDAANSTTFKITKIKLYVPVVTLKLKKITN